MPKKFTKNMVLSEFNRIHLDKYDYSLVDFKNKHTKVKIICRIHGVFEQKLTKHISGQGCPKCVKSFQQNF